MDFFSNLWSGVKSVGSAIKGGLSDLSQYLGNQTASAIGAFNGPLAGMGASKPVTPGQNGMSYAPEPTPDPFANFRQNQTLIPNMSTPYGPGAVNAQGQTVVYGQGGQQDLLASVQANSGSLGSVRPSTYTPPPPAQANGGASGKWNAPTDEFGRQSTSTAGTPFINSAGKLVVPSTGFTGISGMGGGGTTMFSPQNGSQGAEGAGGGGAAFTGLLGASGTSATSSNSLTEEERQRQAKNNTSVISPITPQTGSALNAITAQTAPKFNAPQVPETIDAGWLSKVQETINSVKTAGTSLSDNERNVIISQLANNLVAAKTRLDQQTPLPDNPVVDTQEQHAFLQQSQDPFGLKSAMDAFRAQNTDLGNLQKTRVELMKNVQALNEAYKPIIDDIKHNPDLPKGLARRRLEDLATTQKTTMQGFLDQLDIVGQQISDQNETVNRAFQIVSFSSTQQNQYQDNLRANLQMMINSGAVAAFTPADINGYASALGISAEALTKAKNDALKPKTDQSMVGTSETGYYSVVTNKETGAVVSKTLVIPASPKSTTTDSSSAAQLYGPTVVSALQESATPEQAVFAAVALAKQFGTTLSLKDQQALLNYAKAQKAKSTSTLQSAVNDFNSKLSSVKTGNSYQASGNAINNFLFGNTAQTTTAMLR